MAESLQGGGRSPALIDQKHPPPLSRERTIFTRTGMSRNRALTFALLLMFHHLKSFLFLFFFSSFFLSANSPVLSVIPSHPAFWVEPLLHGAELQEERLERSSQAAGEVG